MPDKRTAQIEDKFRRAPGGLRKRAGWKLLGLPFYDIAIGPDPGRDEVRGYARGFIAIGNHATGVIAIGWIASGVVAIGGCAVGLIGFGALSLAALFAAGGIALGGTAFGGVAIGGVAIGVEASGYYACGSSLARGAHAIDDDRRDPKAIVFFAERGLAAACGHGDIRGKSL